MKFGSSKNFNSWELFADEILRFGIVKQGPVGDDLAKQGLLLPGFKSQDAINKETEKNLASAWKLLEAEISSKSLFASAVRLARADKNDAALIALLARKGRWDDHSWRHLSCLARVTFECRTR
jgi:hypothetical protein